MRNRPTAGSFRPFKVNVTPAEAAILTDLIWEDSVAWELACRYMVRGRNQDVTAGRRGHHTEQQAGICVMHRIGIHLVLLS